jgi:mono/diheme cytochrome c family protein
MTLITAPPTDISSLSRGYRTVIRGFQSLSNFWDELLQSVGCQALFVFGFVPEMLSRISLEVGCSGAAFRLATWGDWDTMKDSRLPPALAVRRSFAARLDHRMNRSFFYLPLLLIAALSLSASGAEPRSGEKIFKAQCASCHGAQGEGVKTEYAQPLVGDKSLLELTELIDKTMPEGEPEAVDGVEAQNVAKFVYDSFYSPVAQARNQSARIELSRLTVRQYQNSVSDLIGSFRLAQAWPEQRGLRGEYFKNRSRRGGDRVIERTDPVVNFDFGDKSPDAEKIPEPQEFSIKWDGSLLAPETGNYDIVVKTDHAMQLWVNDMREPLIDAKVKSGKDTEYRATLRLHAGRVYPLKLEFIKANQGVDDSKKAKERPSKPAMIALEWQPPQRAQEVIPARNLTPRVSAPQYIPNTPFPPDDRSIGYERGTSISKAWDQATTDSALEAAAYMVKYLRDLSGVDLTKPDQKEKLRAFLLKFAERAFRRPLNEEQQKLYIDQQLEEASDLQLGLKRVVLLVLKSPRFLYQEVAHAEDAEAVGSYDVASRLSFALWDSIPDDTLLKDAAVGKLQTPEQVRKHVQRMLPDPRTHAKLRAFLLQWLRVDQAPDLSKDESLFPEFDEMIAADLRTSLEIMLDEICWSESSDFRRLLNEDSIYLNGRLAKLYGAELPAEAGFEKVALNPGERAGVISHPYLLAGFAYTATSSPIHRGVFISRSLLGRSLRPPPEAVAPLAPDLHASLTTRERVALQTKADACNSCHKMINPLGFTLENFDAIGRYRAEEKGKPVDATGSYLTRTGQQQQFKNARELASFLATSDETHTAFVEQLFHYFVKQPWRAYSPTLRTELTKKFAANEFHIRDLLAEIVTTAALHGVPQKAAP